MSLPRGNFVAPRRRLAAFVAALVVVAATAATAVVVDTSAPAPAGADAPARDFSAERARAHLDRFATTAHPIGSEASDTARDYLADRLRTTGLEDVRVTHGVGNFSVPGVAAAGRVENVVGTLPGTKPTGAIILAAHYDSVSSGPGASDDGTAVASILETVRALKAGGALRNDVVVLLTDGEEPGLLGASAFRQAGLGKFTDRPRIALNYEARGTTGPSTLFETSPGNADLVRTYADVAPHKFGDSSNAALYELVPSDSDFTELRKAGLAGLNFAYTDGAVNYHTAGDSIENVDAGSMQSHGANMLALARAFGDDDLGDVGLSGSDETYFRLLGGFFTYPGSFALPIALLTLLLLVVLAVAGRRAELFTVPRAALGAAAALVPVGVSAGLGQLLASTLGWLRPGYTATLGGLYRPGWYELALVAVAVFSVLAWYALVRRRLGPAALTVGALAWPAVLGVACAVVEPGAAHLIALPALAMTAGLLAAHLLRRRGDVAMTLPVLAGTVPGVALLGVFGASTLDLGFLSGAPFAAVAFACALLLVLPLLDLAFPDPVDRPVPRLRAAVPVAGVACCAVAFAGVGFAVDGFDEQHPRSTHLAYVLNTTSEQARWVSADAAAGDTRWLRNYVDGHGSAPLSWRGEPGPRPWVGDAPMITARAPEVKVLKRAGANIRLHVASRRGARSMTVAFDRSVRAFTVKYPGRAKVRMGASGGKLGGWPSRVQLYDVPAGGVTLAVRQYDNERVGNVTAFDQTDGLDTVPGYTPRPRDQQRSPMPDTDQVIVGGYHKL